MDVQIIDYFIGEIPKLARKQFQKGKSVAKLHAIKRLKIL